MSSPRDRFERDERAKTRALGEELRAIYDEADALYAGWTCPGSTDCCHFGRTGREPYVTSIELDLVERARARSGGVSRATPKSLPLADRRCPLLTAEGRCSIYADRPFGCRTFYCDDAEPAGRVKHKQIQELVAKLRELAARHRPGGDAGRPLTRCLAGS